jgi:hypothetical protein
VDRTGQPAQERHWAGINNLDVFREYKLKQAEDSQQLKFIEDYFVYMTDNELSWHYDLIYREITLARMRELAPKAVIIPGFKFGIEFTPEYTWSLLDISLAEFDMNQVKFYANHPMYRDQRPNHFTRASNQFVLAHVRARLEQNRFINWDPAMTTQYTTRQDLYKAA